MTLSIVLVRSPITSASISYNVADKCAYPAIKTNTSASNACMVISEALGGSPVGPNDRRLFGAPLDVTGAFVIVLRNRRTNSAVTTRLTAPKRVGTAAADEGPGHAVDSRPRPGQGSVDLTSLWRCERMTSPPTCNRHSEPPAHG